MRRCAEKGKLHTQAQTQTQTQYTQTYMHALTHLWLTFTCTYCGTSARNILFVIIREILKVDLVGNNVTEVTYMRCENIFVLIRQILNVDLVGDYVAPLENRHVCASRADQIVVVVGEAHLHRNRLSAQQQAIPQARICNNDNTPRISARHEISRVVLYLRHMAAVAYVGTERLLESKRRPTEQFYFAIVIACSAHIVSP
jgi:hypothetical protein